VARDDVREFSSNSQGTGGIAGGITDPGPGRHSGIAAARLLG